MSTRPASLFAIRSQARQVQAQLDQDPYLHEVREMYKYLMNLLHKNLTISVGGKKIKVTVDQSGEDWWWVHYRALFYFALVAKKLNWKTPKNKEMLRRRAEELGRVAARLAVTHIGDKPPYEAKIDDMVACLASKEADCPPKGVVLPMQEFCN